MKTKTLRTAATIMACLLANMASAQLTVGTFFSAGLNEPYGIVEDADFNVYIADSGNNRIVRIDGSSQVATTLAGTGVAGSADGPYYAATFNNPQGLLSVTIGTTPGLLVADYGNNLIRFVRLSDGAVSTIAGTGASGPANNAAGINATFRLPLGMDQDTNGNVYIADSGNNAIRVINLKDPTFGVTNLSVTGGAFYQPVAVAFGGVSNLWVADTGPDGKRTTDNTIKLFSLSTPTTGSLTAFVGGNSVYTAGGYRDSQVGANALFNGPRGLLWDNSVGLLVADSVNNVVRVVTNNPVYGANNYSVTTYAGTGAAGFADGAAATARFNSPYSFVKDIPNGRFLMTDGFNNSIRSIQYGPVLGPCPTPSIGWINFTNDPNLGFISRLVTTPPFTFNNDVSFGISYDLGYQCGYTIDGSQPTKTSSTPPHYRDIYTTSQLGSIALQGITPQSNLVIRAFCYNVAQQNSSTTNAIIHFITANPIFSGQNAASFTVSDLTTNSVLYYTTDGSNPTGITNASVAIFDHLSLTTQFNFSSNNFLFKCFARHGSYQDSGVVSNYFSAASFIPNRITFGLTNGEPSSAFIARPGQIYYAPVTLQLQPGGETMYSLQFNIAVTNGLANTNQIVNAAGLGFFSMLMTQVPKDEGSYFPPADGQWYLPIPPIVGGSINNTSTLFTNINNNLLGVGWFFRTGIKYLYNSLDNPPIDFDTSKQDLISSSIAHDTLFSKGGGVVVAGAYSFQIPINANSGDKYYIQLGSPSATRDGVGAPGANAFIQAPADSTAVTVGTPYYVVGDAAPFHWLNAGDFGEGMLDSADVMQVYQAAILGVDLPPTNSDLYAAMNSSGYLGGWDPANNYYTNSGSAASFAAMFDGNDQTINTNCFGSGFLSIADVYVTYRRSEDHSLVWFKRYWTNSQFVAVPISNLAFNSNTPHLKESSPVTPKAASQKNYQQSSVTFSARDTNSSAGQTIEIPITANVFGDYPLRVLGLNLTVYPLDGSPAITQAVQFTPGDSLGKPTLPLASKYAANCSAAWLDSSITGLTGSNALIGTLKVTIPTNATSLSAYAVHFDHASGSPNGLASFPKQTLTGLITLSDRTNSSCGDGIPDSWRLRWFGTINNNIVNYHATNSATSDGISNYKKFVAGVDPNTANNFPSVKAKTPVPSGSTTAIHWPTVSGKQYAIERSTSLFPGDWTAITTNTGTGTDMEYDDTYSGQVKFYRVRILP